MILEALQAITGIFVVVYDGQHALKFTLGRAGSVVGPGVHFKLPIIQRFASEETKHTTLDLEPQIIQLKDDLVYEVDCKLMYQIVDLRKAIIEVDDLVTGLQNRVVLAVQRVVGAQDRHTVRDTESMIRTITADLRPVEEQWGVRILQFGFSNLSPSPTTLEITQLDLLSRERLALYKQFLTEGLSPEAAVALVTGAVVTTQAPRQPAGLVQQARDEASVREAVEGLVDSSSPEPEIPDPFEEDDEDEDEGTEDGSSS